MNLTEFLKSNFLILDGGMGTLLQAEGLAVGERPELWNLTHPDAVRNIHLAYFNAGANVVYANTFGANPLHFTERELEEVIGSAIRLAREAAERSSAKQAKFVALDIGPTGRLLKPLGDLDFEDAVSLFAAQVRLGAKHGADLIVIETMSDSYETKAALLAAKETCDLPVFVTNAYGSDGKLMTGADPDAMVALLEGLGADAVGVNCSEGPATLLPIVRRYLDVSSLPVLFKPNAGLPRIENGKTVYDVAPAEYAALMRQAAECGVRVLGGCCGTTPEHIRALVEAVKDLNPLPVSQKERAVISSYTHAVTFGDRPVLIGERINPTGKKRLKEALRAHDLDYILNEGIRQQEAGADVLDVNVGLPELDESETLVEVVTALQSVSDTPLQLDTASPAAMEAALRRYNGKALVNSVNGKEEVMRSVFPLVKKYGGMVVALTLDENGIPETVEGRLAIAKKILSVGAEYGLSQKDFLFDPLALTISADRFAARVTLDSVAAIARQLGCHTSLGVSNISFGLPARDTINSAFFALALQNGLSAAILNPLSPAMMGAYRAYLALAGRDVDCAGYLAFAKTLPAVPAPTGPAAGGQDTSKTDTATLAGAIVAGLRERAAALATQLLAVREPLAIINEEIIPALDEVGRGFEEKRVYLPQLLMSAEAAGAAFEKIRASAKAEKEEQKRFPIVLATVAGDIHDIGKNIVRLLLENYGFQVVDLGRDVPAERIVAATVKFHAPLVGLSALMTTTVPAMEETIRRLRKDAPWCRVMVGGAVLTAEYAAEIGADSYSPDAMGAVRYAERLEKEQTK